MNYDVIIIELLAQVQTLEKRIKYMEKRLIEEGVLDESDAFDGEVDRGSVIRTEADAPKKMTTAAIERYIAEKIVNARKKGESSITIVARDIHNELKLKSSYPMVCNAMRKCMTSKDVVVHSTESGYSSTLEIKYIT